ncbi:MAG TPA: polyamine aminopropyltransferase [Desulfomonilaceae bacterium]|nr:polyamine aminopropyltransferase [Desulfomonilaceae bacterium]
MSLIESEWFTEIWGEQTAFSVRYSERLFDRVSKFQRIEIFRTEAMGTVLILGGCFMVTEKDAFIYHEMLVHPAMSVLSHARKVLVIGGGDGGAVTEVMKYPEVESITLCEIDRMVVESCREYFPEISAGLSDSRAQVVCEDGAAYVAGFEEEFDLILVDSTDPVGPGAALFEMTFYQDIKKSLKKDGIAVFQTESPLFMEKQFVKAVKDLREVFGRQAVYPYLATVPSYPGGLWSFTLCSEFSRPLGQAPSIVPPPIEGELQYYTPDVHRAAFALPAFVERLLL